MDNPSPHTLLRRYRFVSCCCVFPVPSPITSPIAVCGCRSDAALLHLLLLSRHCFPIAVLPIATCCSCSLHQFAHWCRTLIVLLIPSRQVVHRHRYRHSALLMPALPISHSTQPSPSHQQPESPHGAQGDDGRQRCLVEWILYDRARLWIRCLYRCRRRICGVG